MKNILFLLFLSMAVIFSCTKEYNYDPNANNNTNTGGNGSSGNNSGYGSLKDFYAVNEVKAHSFSGDIANGISFTTTAGTQVTIPANAFVTLNGDPVTGQVDIQFKDIYRKSDMLLSDVPTMMTSGAPLKSGGEFWIKATSNGVPVKLAPGYSIQVMQPLNGLPYDASMSAYIKETSTLNWSPAGNGAIIPDSGYAAYVFSLYQFDAPEDSGTWCNSDNETYFSSFPQTTFTVNPSFDLNSYHTDVFLIFSGINCMVHVYQSGNSFPYAFAPQGLNCTAVVIAIKDSALYCSFTPVDIGSNGSIEASVAPMTDQAFIAELASLN